MPTRIYFLHISFATIFLLLLSFAAQAQVDSAGEKEKLSFFKRYELDLAGGYRIILPGQMPDSVSLRSSQSNSWFINFGLEFRLIQLVDFRIKPGFVFSALDFQQVADKTFPTVGDSTYELEKLRSTTVELPVGFRFNFGVDEDDEATITFEAGASAGFVIKSSYKLRIADDPQKSLIKIWPVQGVTQLRYGLYADLRYKNIGFHGYYRLSEFFDSSIKYSKGDPDKNFRMPYNDENGASTYPIITPFEIGLIIGF